MEDVVEVDPALVPAGAVLGRWLLVLALALLGVKHFSSSEKIFSFASHLMALFRSLLGGNDELRGAWSPSFRLADARHWVAT